MSSYIKVDKFPEPTLGLRWTEMYSYYGQIDAVIKKDMCFKDYEPETMGEDFYVINDTASKRPYILSRDEFIEKFSNGRGRGGCWVRFMFPENTAGGETA